MSTSHLWGLIESWRDAQLFKVSQAALAEKVGVTRGAMTQWKLGQSRPSPEHLQKLADTTRIPYEHLLYAVVQDMGYITEEEVGDRERSAPSKQAAGSAATGVSPDELDLAAKTKGEGGSLYEQGQRAMRNVGEESQDPDDHKPRRI